MEQVMKKLLFTIITLAFFTGCATLPGAIEEEYLVDKTDKDKTLIENLETKIIAKNREKQSAEQTSKEYNPDIENTKEELDLLSRENRLLKDQLELYTKSKDARNIEIKKEQLVENNLKIEKQKNLLNYQEAQKKFLDTSADLKSAELAVLVAQLDYEKSKIANAYREKTEPAQESEKKGFFSSLFQGDPNDRFGYKKYATHLEKMNKNNETALEKYNKAKSAYEDAKTNIDKSAPEAK